MSQAHFKVASGRVVRWPAEYEPWMPLKGDANGPDMVEMLDDAIDASATPRGFYERQLRRLGKRSWFDLTVWEFLSLLDHAQHTAAKGE